MRHAAIVLCSLLALLCVPLVISQGAEEPGSLLAPSELSTADGKLADPDAFFESADCAECHKEQYEDWKGSLHSRAHHDGIYLAFAERAREEAGDGMYRFCSGCHAPTAVAAGEIPGGKSPTYLTDEGVSCESCHTARAMRERHAGGGANASIVIDAGEVRYGPLAEPAENPVHESKASALHGKSEFCSNCHTLIHPHNKLVIENTYEEWKQSPYAEAGIQCQDCHMRTADEAIEVAKTMKPIRRPGKASEDGPDRPDIKRHLFVGANVNGKLTGASERHSALARKRLRSAATIAVAAKGEVAPGNPLELEVAVTNVGAGHHIPTSITELRQVWIDLIVRDATGREILRSGAIDAATGAVDPKAVMYTAVLADKEGKVTYLPWRAEKMIREKFIPAKTTVREPYTVPVPADAKLPLKVRAVLRYRSAPQEVMDELFGKGKYPIEVVDMCEAESEVR